jgi:hypothetical protein
MPLQNAAEYRGRAERCLMQAKATSDFAIRMQWLSLAEDWRALADNIDMNDAAAARLAHGEGPNTP